MILSYSAAISIALLTWCRAFCAGTGFMRRHIEREQGCSQRITPS